MRPWLQHALTAVVTAALAGLGVQTASVGPLQHDNDELMALVERLADAHRAHAADRRRLCYTGGEEGG